MNTWDTLTSDAVIEKTVAALKANGITAIVVETAYEARQKALEIIPAGAEVMDMTSVTLTDTGISKEISDSGKYAAVKKTLVSMNRETQGAQMQKLGAAPEWSVGSVHAVTQAGQVVVASYSGSQLPGYAYGPQHVLWVVGAQKIVENLDDAMKRIYEHVLPLESERAKKAYGVPGSMVAKLLIFNHEANPTRITMILVKEKLGY